MPQLDGVSIVAIASFFVLVVAWLAAPSTTAPAIDREPGPLPAKAAA